MRKTGTWYWTNKQGLIADGLVEVIYNKTTDCLKICFDNSDTYSFKSLAILESCIIFGPVNLENSVISYLTYAFDTCEISGEISGTWLEDNTFGLIYMELENE